MATNVYKQTSSSEEKLLTKKKGKRNFQINGPGWK